MRRRTHRLISRRHHGRPSSVLSTGISCAEPRPPRRRVSSVPCGADEQGPAHDPVQRTRRHQMWFTVVLRRANACPLLLQSSARCCCELFTPPFPLDCGRTLTC